MALSQSNPSGELGKAWAEGQVKKQMIKIAAVSGDTSGSLTFDRLSRVDLITVSGIVLSAQPTLPVNGGVVAITFNDPLATVAGIAIAWGK